MLSSHEISTAFVMWKFIAMYNLSSISGSSFPCDNAKRVGAWLLKNLLRIHGYVLAMPLMSSAVQQVWETERATWRCGSEGLHRHYQDCS